MPTERPNLVKKDLMPEFIRNLEAFSLSSKERVLIAVSGGPDSMALLHLFLRWDLSRIGVFHLNHGFRKEAYKDAQLVESYAKEAKIPVHVICYDVDGYLKKSGQSKQQGARKIRYRLLGQHARAENYSRIALAHHGDDQAETVLMRLIRGSGLHGLGGIPPQRGPYIRPLLNVYKEDIVEYCREYGIPYVEDATNWQPIYLRNKIRGELIPLLEREYNPEIRSLLVQTAELVHKDELELEKLVDEICLKYMQWQGSQLVFQRSAFNNLSVALQRRVLRSLLYNYQGHLLRISFAHIEDWRSKLREKTTFQLHLPQVAVFANAKYIYVGAFEGEEWEEGELDLPGSFQTKDFTVTAKLYNVGDLPKRPENAEDFDFHSLKFPLVVRRRRPGDRLEPFGGKGSKKLKDLLIDAHIPAAQRDYLPLITSPNGILWVPNVRRSVIGSLHDDTEQVVRLFFSSNSRFHR